MARTVSDRSNASEDDPKRAAGGGSSGYLGYEYQVDVAVWLTLHLVVAHRAVPAVRIEPASQEDLEADVENDDVAGRLTSAAQLESFRLVVQAKLRTGDGWTESKLRDLLEHGGKIRRSAAQRLRADPESRYLLVTSVGLNGDARRLAIGDPLGRWPRELPAAVEAVGRARCEGGSQ